jgi:predicted nucleic acid-binding protein
VTHLLDTSALCAHFLAQPGADEVDRLLGERPGQIGVCVITWFEARYVLKRCGLTERDLVKALSLYRSLPIQQCTISPEVVDRAVHIRDATPTRLPLADALIAGCAAHYEAILVHRDTHLSALPARVVATLRLPDAR